MPPPYINSHIDQCLLHPGPKSSRSVLKTSSAGQRLSDVSESLANTSGSHAVEAKSWSPLQVPPKLVGTLASEKLLRTSLKRYGVPTDGKKQDLIHRYNTFRVEVEAANDRQESTTYESLARKVVQKEKALAAASLLQKIKSSEVKPYIHGCSYSQPVKNEAREELEDNAHLLLSHPREIILCGDDFHDLIKVTTMRDELRKKLNDNNHRKGTSFQEEVQEGVEMAAGSIPQDDGEVNDMDSKINRDRIIRAELEAATEDLGHCFCSDDEVW